MYPTVPIISRYCLGSKNFETTEKKDTSLLDKKYTPAIPHNSVGRRQAREGGLITGWMNNRKRGAPLKITPTNKKMNGKGRLPTKAESASTAATNKYTETNHTPTTIPLPRTVGRKYTNWKHDPTKSAPARAVEAKLKGLDPQLSVGEIIIPDGTLRDHVR